MTDIQLLCVTELLSQFGDQVVKTERVRLTFGFICRVTDGFESQQTEASTGI
jgi:hypothetical protein